MSQNKRDSTVKFEGVDPAEGEEQTVVLDHGLKPSLQGIHAHVDQIVSQFLELFDSIRLVAEDDQYESIGRQFLAATVRTKFVEQGRRIIMVLPAFPAKSPNSRRKVLGKLPDRGEELAFQRLEDFCLEVEKFYSPGAKVVIFSDGRVFSDLLYIPVDAVAAYSQECKRMTADAGHTHITFDNLENHLSMISPQGTPTNQESLIEELLTLHGGPEQGTDDLEERLEHDIGLKKLYRSIKLFVQLDLEPMKNALISGLGMPFDTINPVSAASSRKSMSTSKAVFKHRCGEVAKSMISRNTAFSNLVDKAYPGVVRISIHAHNNAGPKFGVALIPSKDEKRTPHTPWHTVIVETADGQIRAMRREQVDLSEFEIYEHSSYKRPWGFKEKSFIDKAVASMESTVQIVTSCDLTTLANMPIEIKLLHPFGILLHCTGPAMLTPFDIASDTLRRLTSQFGVVVLRGFQDGKLSRDQLVEVAAYFGRIVYWTFGAVLDVTPSITSGSEALPMHWDGVFKFHNSKGEEIDHGDIPGFIVFQCVSPPVGCEEGGETLLTDTRRVVRSGINTEQLSKLSGLEAEYYSDPAASGYFGGRWVRHKLIGAHPSTGEATIRYGEPWTEDTSAKQWTIMRATAEDKAAMLQDGTEFVRELLYNEELFCYKHKWMANDFLLVDNHAVLHARTSFHTASDRHIRRVHFN